MTAFASLLLLSLAPAPRVAELPDAMATMISIQAVARLPRLDAREMALLRVVARAVTRGTSDFVRRDIVELTLGGERPRCTVMPDHLRLELAVPPGALRQGLMLLESLVLNAALPQQALDDATEAIFRRQPGYWEAALWGVDLPRASAKAREARALYRRVFHPRRLFLGVGGSFNAGEAQTEWQRRATAWPQLPNEKIAPPPAAYPSLRTNPGGATTVELRAPAFASDDPSLPLRMLALFALGSGKGASMHRVLREKNGWSYFQEAVLWPEAEGWRPRLIMAMMPTDQAAAVAELARAELFEDAQNWTEKDRLRALGMAEAALLRGLEVHPVYVTVDGPYARSLADRTFLAAYWPMKTGASWDPESLLNRMRDVPLEGLKAAAQDTLAKARAVVLPAG